MTCEYYAHCLDKRDESIIETIFGLRSNIFQQDNALAQKVIGSAKYWNIYPIRQNFHLFSSLKKFSNKL